MSGPWAAVSCSMSADSLAKLTPATFIKLESPRRCRLSSWLGELTSAEMRVERGRSDAGLTDVDVASPAQLVYSV